MRIIALIDLLSVTNLIRFEPKRDVSPLITKNRDPLSTAHNGPNIVE